MPLLGPTVMLTVKLPPAEATLAEACRRLGLGDDEVDHDFGLVAVDPDGGVYAVLVAAEASARAAEVSGPFANPPIEPFGPPDTAGEPEP